MNEHDEFNNCFNAIFALFLVVVFAVLCMLGIVKLVEIGLTLKEVVATCLK